MFDSNTKILVITNDLKIDHPLYYCNTNIDNSIYPLLILPKSKKEFLENGNVIFCLYEDLTLQEKIKYMNRIIKYDDLVPTKVYKKNLF